MLALTLLETTVESFDSIFIHAVIYAVLAVIIIYLLMQKSYKPKAPVVLTASEIQECIEAWNPKPLIFDISEEDEFDLQHIPITQKVNGNHIVINDNEKINCASGNFLGFAHNKQIEESAVSSLRKYGCGSCGPRQFYGTIDVHILFEERMAKFLNTECAILYASGFATATSVISLFSTRLDYVVCDEGVKEAIQMGNYLSRSNVKYFRHNDMGHARELMQQIRKGLSEKQKKKIRCFVIVEGVYQLRGTICPLPELIEIAKENKFRIIMDDSVGLGTIGKTGRGTVEHFGVDINDIDIYIADISLSLGSLGGVCAGTYHMCNFQKINSSGYVFSAFNPPFLASAAIASLNEIDRKPEIVDQLQQNASRLRKLLGDIEELEISGFELSPIIILRLVEKLRTHNRFEDSKTLQSIVDYAMEDGVAITRAIYHKNQKFTPDPCIRVNVMASHTSDQIETIAHVIRTAVQRVLSQ